MYMQGASEEKEFDLYEIKFLFLGMISESIEDVLLNSIMALIEKLFKSPSDSWISTQHHAEY